MNVSDRRQYLLALAAIAVLASGCTVRERRRETITRQWPAAGIERVKLTEVNGSIDVTASESNAIELTAHVRTRGVKPEPGEENKGYFRTTIDGDTLRIGRREGGGVRFFPGSDDIQIQYVLRVPPTVALELTTANGRVVTRGIAGETEVATVNGSIDLETPGTSEVNLTTVNGRVRAKFLSDFRGARMKTVNGSVEAVLPPDASFACDLSQVNGDFEASFPLSIHSHPGSRRVSGEVNGGRHNLKIVTVNGDIRIDTGLAPPAPPAPPAAPQAPVTPSAPPVPPAPST